MHGMTDGRTLLQPVPPTAVLSHQQFEIALGPTAAFRTRGHFMAVLHVSVRCRMDHHTVRYHVCIETLFQNGAMPAYVTWSSSLAPPYVDQPNELYL